MTVVNGTTQNSTAAWTAAGIAQGNTLINLNNQYLNSCTNIGEVGNLDAIVINGGTPGHFPPGCYYRAGAMNIAVSATVNLDGAGTYIFKSTGGAVTTGANSAVVLNGASACDVFWTPVAATTLGANSTFKGTVIDAAGITIGDTVAWLGRALAYGGTITSNGALVSTSNTITVPACTNPASVTVTKVVVNNNGRTKVVSDFPLFVGAAGVASGILNNFAPGTYAITETLDPAYAQTFSGSCASGSITLASDGNYACTITNDDIPTTPQSGSSHRSTNVVTSTTVTVVTATTTPFVAPPFFVIPSLPNTGLPPESSLTFKTLLTYLGILSLISASAILILQKRKS